MESYLYYCIDCNKLFKAGGIGRKVKCASCSGELIDLEISDEDYAALNPKEREELKRKARESVKISGIQEPVVTDNTANENVEKKSQVNTSENTSKKPSNIMENHTGVITINDLIYNKVENTEGFIKEDTVKNPVSQDDTDTKEETEIKTETETEIETEAETETDGSNDNEIFSAFFNIGDSFNDPSISDDYSESATGTNNDSSEEYEDMAAQNSAKLRAAIQKMTEEAFTIKNSYIATQIQNQILAVDNFMSICKLSALKDDGVVDKDEAKLLKKLEKASDEYKKVLSKMIEQ